MKFLLFLVCVVFSISYAQGIPENYIKTHAVEGEVVAFSPKATVRNGIVYVYVKNGSGIQFFNNQLNECYKFDSEKWSPDDKLYISMNFFNQKNRSIYTPLSGDIGKYYKHACNHHKKTKSYEASAGFGQELNPAEDNIIIRDKLQGQNYKVTSIGDGSYLLATDKIAGKESNFVNFSMSSAEMVCNANGGNAYIFKSSYTLSSGGFFTEKGYVGSIGFNCISKNSKNYHLPSFPIISGDYFVTRGPYGFMAVAKTNTWFYTDFQENPRPYFEAVERYCGKLNLLPLYPSMENEWGKGDFLSFTCA